MKKNSTTQMSSSGMRQVNKKLTIGLDLGDQNSRYCVLDEQGDAIREGGVPTTRKGLDRVLGAMPRAPGCRRISRCRMLLSFSPRSGHSVKRIEVEVDALSIRQSSLDLPSQIIGEHLIAAAFDCTQRLSN